MNANNVSEVKMTTADEAPLQGEVVSRSFEFRAVSSDPAANGETDFKGESSTLSTEERVAFLNAYADYAAAWFDDPGLDTPAVTEAEVDACLATLQEQPLATVRTTLPLNDGWQMACYPTPATGLPRPWRTLPGAELKAGVLCLPGGRHTLFDFGNAGVWRYEVSWRMEFERASSPVVWFFGGSSYACSGEEGWHAYRLQADLTCGTAWLSRDGERVAEIALEPGGKIEVESVESFALDDFVVIDYRPLESDITPYRAVVLADDNFDPEPDLAEWQAESCSERGWWSTTLPAVCGGFREAGGDLYLRRTVELPTAARVWLAVEALDPGGEIYLNGKSVCRVTGRKPLLLEVTAEVCEGSNLLVLRVDHYREENPMRHTPDDRAIGWFAGRVTLHLLPAEVAIADMRVHTAELADNGVAQQSHTVKLDNAGRTPFVGSLVLSYRPWYPQAGEELVSSEFPISLPAKSVVEFTIPLALSDSAPWTPERPQLYAVTALLKGQEGELLDDLVVTTGVRTIAQVDGGLLLNNTPAMLNGAQNIGYRPVPRVEHAAKYNRCAPVEVLLREMLAIKKMGGNLLRLHLHAASAHPDGVNDRRIAELADQLGLALIWAPPGWIREDDERRIDYTGVGTFIWQLYNHPSIVIWELSNHPNRFKLEEDNVARTDDFVRQSVNAVLPYDTTRLISPTTFWGHTHYGNDLGTRDHKGRPIEAVPEYTHRLTTRGSQDAVTGYGAEWTQLRSWPYGMAADTLANKVRAWFNFEHEESAAQPNWTLSYGWPWHRIRSYEKSCEEGSIGRVLDFEEWRASQAWQAFSAYESMRKQIQHGVAGFSWCTIEGGANSGTYEKPLLDPLGHAKLAWHIHKMVFQPVLAGSDNVDVVYGPDDQIVPTICNLGAAFTATLKVEVMSLQGEVTGRALYQGIEIPGGRSVIKLAPLTPQLPADDYCVVVYTVYR